MSGGNFDGVSFDGSIGGFDVDSTADTHDGFRPYEDVRSFEDENRRLEALRQVFKEPVSEEVFAEVRQITKKAERLESGAVRIDWEGVGKEVEARILAIVRKRIEDLEQDDEEVILLAIH